MAKNTIPPEPAQPLNLHDHNEAPPLRRSTRTIIPTPRTGTTMETRTERATRESREAVERARGMRAERRQTLKDLHQNREQMPDTVDDTPELDNTLAALTDTVDHDHLDLGLDPTATIDND
ncbi:hypothetical protein C0991_009201, partial [Blastosporella zonata]